MCPCPRCLCWKIRSPCVSNSSRKIQTVSQCCPLKASQCIHGTTLVVSYENLIKFLSILIRLHLFLLCLPQPPSNIILRGIVFSRLILGSLYQLKQTMAANSLCVSASGQTGVQSSPQWVYLKTAVALAKHCLNCLALMNWNLLLIDTDAVSQLKLSGEALWCCLFWNALKSHLLFILVTCSAIKLFIESHRKREDK